MRSRGAVAGVEKRADDHDASHFAVRARGGLKRDARQTRDLREMLLEFVNDFEGALRVALVSERMKICEPCDTRDAFVEARVVLHRARAQRVHAEIDRIVPGGHANEVPNDVHFADFGHAFEIVVATKLGWNVQWQFIDVQRRQSITDSSGLGAFEDELLIWADVAGDFCYCSCHRRINHKDTKTLTEPARLRLCAFVVSKIRLGLR